jgi:hypothetical protein
MSMPSQRHEEVDGCIQRGNVAVKAKRSDRSWRHRRYVPSEEKPRDEGGGGAKGSEVVFEEDRIRLWINPRGVVSQELTSPVEP